MVTGKSLGLWPTTVACLFALTLSANNAVARPDSRLVSPKTLALDDYALALQLAIWGRTHQNALALVVAAEIANRVTPNAGRFTGVDRVPPESDQGVRLGTTERMLAEAKEYRTSELLRQQIETAERSAARGSDGPGCLSGFVDANAKISTGVIFHAREPAKAVLVGWSANLYLAVYGGDGTEICLGTSNGALQSCEWLPASESTFTLRVENRDENRGSNFELCTN
jgi:hypothetical protein